MADVRVRLDHAGMAALLESPGMTAVTRQASEAVAAGVREQGHQVTSGAELPVEVRLEPAVPSGRIRDRRQIGLVTVVHPAGMGMQAKYGVLTRAAGAAGLEVTERSQ